MRRGLKINLSEKKLSLPILKRLDEIKKGENNIVLFGYVGSGKTSLLNKICGQSYLISDRGYSCTRNYQYDFSLKNDMVIIDLPGLCSIQDPIGHLKIQRSALSAIPIRMICFVISYSPRNDDFERQLHQMIPIFYNYIKNITIIITKSEEIDLKRKEEIKFIFKTKFNIENTIFSTKKYNGYDLCDDLKKIKEKMENIKQILVKTRDLSKTIISQFNPDINEEKELFKDKFEDALEKFKKEVKKAKDPDLKRALYFAFKDYKDILLDEYTNTIRKKKINGKEPDMDQIIAEILMFNNEVFNEFNEFRKIIESQIELKSSNYNGEFNRFKKCPHCGTIWFKIIGCDSIVCGTRTSIEDKIIGKYKNYTVTYLNNEIIIKESQQEGKDEINEVRDINEVEDNISFDHDYDNEDGFDFNDNEFFGLTNNEKEENFERIKNGKIKIKPLGCGKTCNWSEMEDCSEEVIKKLKEISIDDYDSGIFNISEKYNK